MVGERKKKKQCKRYYETKVMDVGRVAWTKYLVLRDSFDLRR